ncbi:hypothetical protein MRX96_027129 [Rhipicephalus microplus]
MVHMDVGSGAAMVIFVWGDAGRDWCTTCLQSGNVGLKLSILCPQHSELLFELEKFGPEGGKGRARGAGGNPHSVAYLRNCFLGQPPVGTGSRDGKSPAWSMGAS